MAFWDPRDCNMLRRDRVNHPKMPHTDAMSLIEFDDETRPKVKKHFDTQLGDCSIAVSYTHLTLPTIYSV